MEVDDKGEVVERTEGEKSDGNQVETRSVSEFQERHEV